MKERSRDDNASLQVERAIYLTARKNCLDDVTQ